MNFRPNRQRAYVLFIVMASIILMVSFLFAVQSSAIVGKTQLKRQADRMTEQQWIDRALARAASAIERGEIQAGIRVTAEYAEGELTISEEEFASELNPYGLYPSLKEKPGDRVAEVLVLRDGGQYKVRQVFLLNGEGHRSAPVRLK